MHDKKEKKKTIIKLIKKKKQQYLILKQIIVYCDTVKKIKKLIAVLKCVCYYCKTENRIKKKNDTAINKKKTDFHDNKCVETESECINNLNDDSCENDKKTVKL